MQFKNSTTLPTTAASVPAAELRDVLSKTGKVLNQRIYVMCTTASCLHAAQRNEGGAADQEDAYIAELCGHSFRWAVRLLRRAASFGAHGWMRQSYTQVGNPAWGVKVP